MNLKALEEMIFKHSSSLMKKHGEEIFRKNFVSNLKGKRIENMYHVYGDVKDLNLTHRVHIKLDIQGNTLEGASCNCEEYREISRYKKIFMCKHINAVSYKFLDSLYKKKHGENSYVQGHEKDAIELDVKIEYKKWEKDDNYILEFRAGSKNKVLVTDLKAFVKEFNHEKKMIAKKDIPLFLYLKEKVDGTKSLENGSRSIIIKENELKAFLKTLGNRKILFRYNGIEYKADILNKDLPLTFTLKGNERNLILTTHKNIPMALDENKEVYFFLDNIYVPSNHQSEKYKMFHERFMKNNTILYKKTQKNYKLLLEILSSISDNIMISENIRNLELGPSESDEPRLYDSSSINLELHERNGGLVLSYSIDDIEEDELKEVLRSYKAGSKAYRIGTKGFLDFEDEEVKSFFNLLDILNSDKNIIEIDKNKESYLNVILENTSMNINKGLDVLENIKDRFSNLEKKERKVGKNFKGKLRNYQKDGFKWFKNLSELEFGGILADEMGLGKTIQTIAFLSSEKSKKTLIVAPTSLIYNWDNEFKKFSPDLKVGIFHSNEVLIDNLKECNIILTTYGLVRNHIESFKKIEFDYCIIDEAQNIKNSLGKNTAAVKEIKSKVRFALTGTPIENNLLELWSIFDFIMPGYLFPRKYFEEKFIGKEDMETLRLLVKHFILRRTKSEVVKELPDKIEKKMLISMTSEQNNIYKKYINDVKKKIKENKGNKIEIFSYLTRLRQVCLDPSILFEEYTGGSGKLNVALELIEKQNKEGGKILLFSQFTSVLKKIEPMLKERNIEYLYLDGSTSSKERINLVDDFNKKDKIKVFLISLKAGGTGLNLTSANFVIHFDPWWNPAVEAQATDRAHRIGQKNIVEVIKLIAKGTIEEQILNLQEAKKQLVNEVITDEFREIHNLDKLTIEEIIEVINRE